MNQTNESKKSRGRPSSFLREEMLETIMQLFWDRGYHALSFNEISKETGLTRASLYNAFTSKEALLLETLEHYFKDSPDNLLNSIDKGNPVGNVFYTLFRLASKARVDDPKKRGCLAVNCLSELLSKEGELSETLATMYEQKRILLKKLVKQAIFQKELPKDTDAEITANLLLAYMTGFSTFSKSGISEKKLRTMSFSFLEKLGFQPPH